MDVPLPDQLQELFDGHARVANETSQESPIEFSVIGHAEVQWFARLGQDHVTAALPVKDPARLLEGAACFSPADNWQLRHVRGRPAGQVKP
jgi:hypothetical protein